MLPVSLPLASRCQFASDDFEAMHARLSTVLKPHGLRRLSDSPVAGIICRARLNRISFNVLRIGPSVEVAPGALEDFFLVQIPIVGTVELCVGREQIKCEGATAAVISPGERLHLRWSDNCTQLILQIPHEAMESSLAQRLGRKSATALRFQAAFDLDASAGREWRQLLDVAVRSIEHDGILSREPASSDLEDLLLSALLAAQPHNYVAALRRHPDPAPFYIVRAEREMRRRLRHAFTVAGLASAAGVSERTLHLGFRRFRSTTPMGRLAALRLHEARRLLGNAEPNATVAQVAAEVGFHQFGRFAAAYRNMFGELPSQTLRGSRRFSK
jgi:AraC-like DNA-binding protein